MVTNCSLFVSSTRSGRWRTGELALRRVFLETAFIQQGEEEVQWSWSCEHIVKPPFSLSLPPSSPSSFSRVLGDLSWSCRGEVGRLSPPAVFLQPPVASSWILGLKESLGLSLRSPCSSAARPGQTEQVSRLRAFYFPRGRGSESGQRGPGGEALNWGFMSLSYRLEEI